MQTTLDLLSSPRIETGKDPETGRNFVRYRMGGRGADLVGEYWQEPRPADMPKGISWDDWRYSLSAINGKGGTYSHPTEDGCKLMILRHLLYHGYLQIAVDNAHLDERNTAILAETRAAWEARTGRPRVGDFVILPNGIVRRCSAAWDDGMQTSDGGSYYIGRSGLASMSGALYGVQLWEYFKDTGETRPGKFWFFSHNLPSAGRGVDVLIPCRVYRLEPFTMTEEEARAHPRAKSSGEFWGENHAEHLKTIASLMNPRALRGDFW